MKPLEFVGSALDDLRELPEVVQGSLGYGLHLIQQGETPSNAKPLKGLSGVWELREDHKTDTYRAVYIAKLNDKIYVLHCFQKKSKHGIGIPRNDKFIIESRLKRLMEKR